MPGKPSNFLKSVCTLTAAACLTLPAGPAYADRPDSDSPLTVNQQRALKRAVGYAKKGRADKATPIYTEILSACTDLPKCIAVASYTEQYGFATVDARRAIMEKAFEMCRTYDDYILVAMKSRQYECFDVTRKSVQQLISVSETPEQLMDLATKALEVSMTDVAHLAMEKAYTVLDSVPEAIDYARLAGLMGMVDLQRKVVREMIDDEPNAHELMVMLRKIEPMKLKDLDRYLLKKALDQASTVADFNDIWEAARRHNYKDIFDLAAYRGKKMQLIKRMQADRAAHQERIDAWKQGQDAAQQRVIKDIQGGGSPPPPSGF